MLRTHDGKKLNRNECVLHFNQLTVYLEAASMEVTSSEASGPTCEVRPEAAAGLAGEQHHQLSLALLNRIS